MIPLISIDVISMTSNMDLSLDSSCVPEETNTCQPFLVYIDELTKTTRATANQDPKLEFK